MDKDRVVHRWQITGKTPCGRPIEKVATNEGEFLSRCVTCKRCLRAKSVVAAFVWPEGAGATNESIA